MLSIENQGDPRRSEEKRFDMEVDEQWSVVGVRGPLKAAEGPEAAGGP